MTTPRVIGIAALALAIGALSVLHPVAAILAVAGLGVAGLALCDLSILVAISVAFNMLTEPWDLAVKSLPIGSLDLYANDILLLALLGGLILGALRRGRPLPRLRDPISITLFAFLLYGLFSLARGYAIHGARALPAFRLRYLYGLLYFLVLHVMTSPESRRRLLAAVLGSGVLIGLYGIWNALTGANVGHSTSSHTLRYLSGLQAMVLFFALALVAGTIWSRRRPLWSVVCAALYLIGILLAQARSVWLGAVMGVAVAYSGSTGAGRQVWRRYLPAVLLVGLVVVVILVATNLDIGGDVATRAASLSNVSGDITTVWRLFVWGEALKEVRANPILGLGLGKRFVYFDVVKEDWRSNRQLHNTYVALAYHSGAIGVGLFILFQLLVLWRVLTAARRHAGEPREAKLLALACCQVCLAAVAFTNVIGASMVSTTYVWILSAVSVLEARG